MGALWMADDWLILQFERFGHWFQRLTGRTNFFLAALCDLANSALCVAFGFWTSDIVYLIFSFFFLSYSIGNLYREKSALGAESRRYMNPMKAVRFFKLMRVIYPLFGFFVSMGLSGTTGVGIAVIALLVWIAIYLEACDPLPPGTSKIRQWLNSMKAALSAEPTPVGVWA